MRLKATSELGCLVALLLSGLAIYPPSTMAGSDTCHGQVIAWSTPRVKMKTLRGTSSIHRLSLKSCRPMNATLFVSPSVAGMVTAVLAGDSHMAVGTARDVELLVSVPATTSPGVYEGTVHVLAGRKTVPDTLKVTVRVIDETQSSWIPTEFAMPSQDRLGSDGNLQLVTDEVLIGIDQSLPDPLAYARDIASDTGGVVIGANAALRVFQLRFSAVAGDWIRLKQLRDALRAVPFVTAASRNFVGSESAAPIFPNDTILWN